MRIQDLEYDETSDKLLAATLGRGVFTVSNVSRELNHQSIKTGEVEIVSLPANVAGKFSITSVELIRNSGAVIPLVMQRHPLRGDLQLFNQGQMVGELAFSERFDGFVNASFSDTGSFVFAPNSFSNLTFDDAKARRSR